MNDNVARKRTCSATPGAHNFESIIAAWEANIPQFVADYRSQSPCRSEFDIDVTNVGLNVIGNLLTTKASSTSALLTTGFLHRHELWSPASGRGSTPDDLRIETSSDPGPSPTISNCKSDAISDGAIEKINRLESEVDDLRRLIARLVHAQETAAAAAKSRSPLATPLPDAIATPQSFAPPPPPPPLPPPPPPPLPPANWRTPVAKTSSSVPNTAESQKKQPPQRARFSVTARDLTSVRLKKVQRSPGGTPLKEKNTSDPSDPGAYLAAVLRSRFSALHGDSPSPSPRQSMSPLSEFEQLENRPPVSANDNPGKTPVSTVTLRKHQKLFDGSSRMSTVGDAEENN